MRLMIFVKATKSSETGAMPAKELLEARDKYNQELIAEVPKAPCRTAEDCTPRRKALARRLPEDRTVTMGPFAQTSELVLDWWLWKCKSLEEAIDW